MKPLKLDHCCPACGAEMELSVWPYVPAVISGPPDSCSPEEGGEIEPDTCPCGYPVDQEKVHERIADMMAPDPDLDRQGWEEER